MKKGFLIICLNILWFNADIKAQETNPWTLEKCIDYALNQNIQVRKSTLTNQSYQYYADQARAQQLPSFSASVNQNFNWNKGTEINADGETTITPSRNLLLCLKRDTTRG